MADRRAAFATSSTVNGITDDDLLVARELRARGWTVDAATWNDAGVDWAAFDLVVLRSTWDYHLHVGDFLEWLSRLDRLQVDVRNPVSVIRWNSKKSYLRDLETAGVRIVPTRWIPQHDQAALADIAGNAQWERFVVKPAVSASAHRTWRGALSEATLLEASFRAMVTHGDVLVQPFLDEVITTGEWSLLFYGGAYSHSVLKKPRADDFRVQREHGGSSITLDAPAAAVAGAAQALAAAERLCGPTRYARVDGYMVSDAFVLMELELIEPDLYLRASDDAPRRLADALDS